MPQLSIPKLLLERTGLIGGLTHRLEAEILQQAEKPQGQIAVRFLASQHYCHMQLFSLTSQAGGEESWELITMGVLESLGASSALIKPHLNNEHMLFIFLESSEDNSKASPAGSLVAVGLHPITRGREEKARVLF